jgi:hypothetical protein
MNASTLPANQNALPIRLELVVTDAEVTHELSLRPEGRDRDEFARQALRLGVLSLRQASGALDSQAIAREADRLLGAVGTLLGKHVDGEHSVLARTLDRALKAQSDELLKQFSPDRPDSALRRLLDRLATENGKVHKELAQFQTDVRATLEAFTARREEAARTTTHGNTFEAAVGDFLRLEAQRTGDLYEPVGTLTGQLDRKTGDHVLTLGPDSAAPEARIVCEAKARKGYSERSALEELARARKNRDAQVGIVVMDRASAPEGTEVVRRIGDDVLVVWDADDPESDLALRLAVSLARSLCVRERVATSATAASLAQLDGSIETIANQIRAIDEIIHSGRLIKRRGDKVVASAERLREVLEREVATLQDRLRSLRKEAS